MIDTPAFPEEDKRSEAPSGDQPTESAPEWLTAFLDGETSGQEKQNAKKALQESSDIRRVAQDIQRVEDLLDFLPLTGSPRAKIGETAGLVLEQSSSQPVVVEGNHSLEERADLSKRTEVPVTRFDPIYVATSPWPKRVRGWLIAVLLGAMAAGLVLTGWRFFEDNRAKELGKIRGVVDNFQILHDSGDLDFLRAIDVPELFGQPESMVSQ